MILDRNSTRRIPLITVLLFATSSCSDERVTQVAREAANRQAQQNTEMSQLNREVASGTHQLVEADAKARTEIIGVHHDLQTERTRLDTSWHELEAERRQIATQRQTQSMLVSICELLGGLSLVIMLLGFCWYALFTASRGDGVEAQLNELLIQEILADDSTPLQLTQGRPQFLGHAHPNEPSGE